MTIGAIISGRDAAVHSAVVTDTVRDVVARLTALRIGAMPVLDDNGAVTGIFSERDVIHCLESHGAAALDQTVETVMTSPAITIDPATTALAALSLMSRRRIRHLPVVQDGQLTGFVSIGDLVKHRIEKIESEADAMRDYIAGS
jgi:CBS domain-containing protein